VVELRSLTLRQPLGGCDLGEEIPKVMPRGRMVYILLRVTMGFKGVWNLSESV